MSEQNLTVIQVTSEHHEELKILAIRKKVTLKELARVMVVQFLKSERKPDELQTRR